jgi:hypothetical protein
MKYDLHKSLKRQRRRTLAATMTTHPIIPKTPRKLNKTEDSFHERHAQRLTQRYNDGVRDKVYVPWLV